MTEHDEPEPLVFRGDDEAEAWDLYVCAALRADTPGFRAIEFADAVLAARRQRLRTRYPKRPLAKSPVSNPDDV